MNKAFHCVFKYHGPNFLRHWERLQNTYQAFLDSNDPTQRQWGLCIMDDVLEYCGPQSSQYANLIMQPLLRGCRDPSPAIRQAAAYGIGVAARHGGEAWSAFLGGAVPLLFEVMTVPDARNEDNIYATENACAAIAKILHFNASAVTAPDQIIAEWINTLPITNDEEAAPYAYLYLAELISKQHPAVTSQAPRVFVLVAQALEAEALSGQNAARVVAATKVLLEGTNTDVMPLLQQFSPEAQNVIRAHFG
jgi:hypothetical protein